MRRKTYIESGVLFHVIGSEKEFHSFHDLNLVLAPFVIPPAKPKISLLDIEGRDGALDLSEANGEIKYHDREFTFRFSVFPNDELTFEERQTVVSNALNGKRCKITLDKDPDCYYIGRCTVDEYLCDKNLCQIVIKATVAPYKMLQHETVVTFHLQGGKQDLVLLNRRKTTFPTVSCTEWGTRVYISADKYVELYNIGDTVINIPLVEGVNTVTVMGQGDITFTYQEGDL